MEDSRQVPQKLKQNSYEYESVTPPLGTCLEEVKSPSLRDTCTPRFIAALLTRAKTRTVSRPLLKSTSSESDEIGRVQGGYGHRPSSESEEWALSICDIVTGDSLTNTVCCWHLHVNTLHLILGTQTIPKKTTPSH